MLRLRTMSVWFSYVSIVNNRLTRRLRSRGRRGRTRNSPTVLLSRRGEIGLPYDSSQITGPGTALHCDFGVSLRTLLFSLKPYCFGTVVNLLVHRGNLTLTAVLVVRSPLVPLLRVNTGLLEVYQSHPFFIRINKVDKGSDIIPLRQPGIFFAQL